MVTLSQTLTYNITMAGIPMDIILTHIFPKVPAKSLLVLKCVCKSWQTYISSPEFISLHLKCSLSSDNKLLILTTTHNSLVLLPLNTLNLPTNLPFPTSSVAKQTVAGSCDGLVCVQDSAQGLPVCVFNPSTGFYKNTPSLLLPRRPRAVNFGFGYDHVNDDFKVVRLLDFYSGRTFLRALSRQVNVYSLKNNAWRLVEWSAAFDCAKDGENGALLNNHLIHWMVWCFVENKCKIRCFDLCEEKWVGDVPMPDHESANVVQENGPNIRGGVIDFGVFDGYLFMSRKSEQQSDQLNVVDLWIMKEYGVKESWVKLLSISDVRFATSLRMTPIVYTKGRNKVLLRREYKSEHILCWYNVEDKSVETAEFYGVGDCFWVDICIGSLVSIPDAEQFHNIQTT